MAVRGIRKKNNHSPVKYNVNSLVSFAKEKGLIENDKLDINTLVNELGLNLKFQILPPDVSGKLQKFNGQWTIIVNKFIIFIITVTTFYYNISSFFFI